ncbi:adenylosuccinate synthetase [Candidatus Woesearchaeota archaeon]|nr:MAG: adenylosuccinate synthetase [Candidatus Woesearchaeota archaeon]
MTLDVLLKDKQIAAIVCNQFGDTGKGKFVDLLAQWADVIVRGTGGANAGHTIEVGDLSIITHLIPAGILYDKEGKVNMLGNGMAIDLSALTKELDMLDRAGVTYNNLMISKDAHVVFDYHILEDKLENQSLSNGGIGSTGRGIGPCYADKTARRGITIEMLLGDRDKLLKQLDKNVKRVANLFPGAIPDVSAYLDKLLTDLQPHLDRINPFIKDTDKELKNFISQGKKILLEGAQGLGLSIEYGTYPYVTSSDCSIRGLAYGVGLSPEDVDITFGIVKYPFMTRVGGGPFPSELGGVASENYCAGGTEHDMFYEAKTFLDMSIDLDEIRRLQKTRTIDAEAALEKYKSDTVKFIKENRTRVLELANSSDPFFQGIGIRLAAYEYGATTSRPRRTGWTDAVMASYAVSINGPHFILTKADCLDGVDEFKINYGYEDASGTVHTDFNRSPGFLESMQPVFSIYEGCGNISDAKDFSDFPPDLLRSFREFEQFTKGNILVVSTGPKRDQYVVKDA